MLLLLLIGAGASTPPPPVEAPYQGDVYYYDVGAGTGSISDGEQLPPETIYD